jgi:dephospho-CoA kinase
MKAPDPKLSQIRAQAGSLGGKTVTAKKLAHLASVVVEGRKVMTEKRRAHLAAIAASGGKTVTEKKREHLRRALAARWAKAKK